MGAPRGGESTGLRGTGTSAGATPSGSPAAPAQASGSAFSAFSSPSFLVSLLFGPEPGYLVGIILSKLNIGS